MSQIGMRSLAIGALAALSLAPAGIAWTQETSGGARVVAGNAPTTNVTQAMLNNAASDSKNFLSTNGNYNQSVFIRRTRSIPLM